jgi:hypothetical protein
MATFHKQYSTATSGTISIQNTKQDVHLIHDNGSLAATLTITFPANPVDGQKFGVTSNLGVTALTLTSAITIVNALTAIVAGGFATWMYDVTANKWFRIA